jgi:Immunity protein 52
MQLKKVQVTKRQLKDIKLIGYDIDAWWGPRREAPKSIATRFLNLVDRLTAIDPVFDNWIYSLDEAPVMLDTLRDEMEAVVERHVSRADDGAPVPINGYSAAVVNSLRFEPRRVSIYVRAGAWYLAPYLTNYIDIGTSRKAAADPALVTYPIFRAALLALAETFETTWCAAYPRDIMIHWKTGSFRLGWMSYVSPRFAPLVTPPATAIVEYRPNGALFMAATDETFVTTNPQHMAVAQDIEASLAPLNALPWPPDAEPA